MAQRDADNYDIYKKSIKGGEETKLTDNKGSHADGPEYSPDGKYIYYNASTTGTMQIWRMKPDGSDKDKLLSISTMTGFHISLRMVNGSLLSPSLLISTQHPIQPINELCCV